MKQFNLFRSIINQTLHQSNIAIPLIFAVSSWTRLFHSVIFMKSHLSDWVSLPHCLSNKQSGQISFACSRHPEKYRQKLSKFIFGRCLIGTNCQQSQVSFVSNINSICHTYCSEIKQIEFSIQTYGLQKHDCALHNCRVHFLNALVALFSTFRHIFRWSILEQDRRQCSHDFVDIQGKANFPDHLWHRLNIFHKNCAHIGSI